MEHQKAMPIQQLHLVQNRAIMQLPFAKLIAGGVAMKLTPPTMVVFWICVALAVLGLLGAIGVAFLAPFAFWLEFIGLALLIIALLVKGL